MQLLILVLIAGVVGYFLAKSRLSKPIDDTTGKVADGTRKAASSAEGWFSRTFRRDRKPKDEVVEAQAKPAKSSAAAEAAPKEQAAPTKQTAPKEQTASTTQEAPTTQAAPAAKQSSRRHSEDESAA